MDHLIALLTGHRLERPVAPRIDAMVKQRERIEDVSRRVDRILDAEKRLITIERERQQ